MRVVHFQNQPKEKKPSKKELAMADAVFLTNHLSRFSKKRADRMEASMIEMLSKLSEQEIEALTHLAK